MFKFLFLVTMLIFPEFCFMSNVDIDDDGFRNGANFIWKGDRTSRLVSNSKVIVVRMAGNKVFKLVNLALRREYAESLILPDEFIKYSIFIYPPANGNLDFDFNAMSITSASLSTIKQSDKIFQCFTKILIRDLIGSNEIKRKYYRIDYTNDFYIQLERVLELYNLLDVTSSYQEINRPEYAATMLFELTDRFTVENYCKENRYL